MREVRDFVKDMVLRGRVEEQVVCVARCTRWKNDIEEAKDWFKRRAKKWTEFAAQSTELPVKRKKRIVLRLKKT